MFFLNKGKKMKNRILTKIFMIAGLSMLISGCVTPIAQLEITKFDRESVSLKNSKEINDAIKAKYGKRMRVTLEPSTEITPAMKKQGEYLSEKLSVSLNSLSFFQIVATKQLGSITKMNATAEVMDGEKVETKVDATDYMITYKLVSCKFVKDKLVGIGQQAVSLAGSIVAKRDDNLGDAIKGGVEITKSLDTRAEATLRVSLVNVTDLSTIDFLVRGESELGQNGDKELFRKAIDDAVGRVIARLAMMYGPPAKVLATKGEGKAALVNIGTYLGAQINSTVDFIEYSVDDDTGELIEMPFASGIVIEKDQYYLENKKCWVRVDKPGLVKKNTLVRLRGLHTSKFF